MSHGVTGGQVGLSVLHPLVTILTQLFTVYILKHKLHTNTNPLTEIEKG